MIFDCLTPTQSPRGVAKFCFAVSHPIHVSNSHTKFGWISSYGVGGEGITIGQREFNFDP